MIVPPAQMPPALTGNPAMGFSPTGASSGNPGLAAAALTKVRSAVELLETALPTIPVGSPPYDAVLNAIKALAKHVPASSAVPGVQGTELLGLQQQAQQQAPLQALMRSLQGGGAPGGPGAGASPQAQPQGAAPAMAA